MCTRWIGKGRAPFHSLHRSALIEEKKTSYTQTKQAFAQMHEEGLLQREKVLVLVYVSPKRVCRAWSIDSSVSLVVRLIISITTHAHIFKKTKNKQTKRTAASGAPSPRPSAGPTPRTVRFTTPDCWVPSCQRPSLLFHPKPHTDGP